MNKTRKQKLIEALYEIINQTKWKDDGGRVLDKIIEGKNISLDYDKIMIEIQDKNGIRTLYKIAIT